MEQIVSPELSQPITNLPLPSESLEPDQIDPTFANSTLDLISLPLSPTILHVSNEFFAPAINLLTPTPPISRPGVFIETGAWYDGWESRRHNTQESDSVVIRLGAASGVVQGVEVDTAFFTGNHAPEISVEGCFLNPENDKEILAPAEEQWIPILGRRKCSPSRRHAWIIKSPPNNNDNDLTSTEYDGRPITHVRLRMYPDGGIARFRLYGRAIPITISSPSTSPLEIELSSALNGGLAISASDQHYSHPRNLLLPGRGKDMSDGWETKRSRTPGHVDWAIIRLGARGCITRIVVDTMHFRGNFPREIRVEIGDFADEDPSSSSASYAAKGVSTIEPDAQGWVSALKDTTVALKADTEFEFSVENKGLSEEVSRERKVWTHAKLVMVPDGGIKRFRVFGMRG